MKTTHWICIGLTGLLLFGGACSQKPNPPITFTVTTSNYPVVQQTTPVDPNLGFFTMLGTQPIVPGEVEIRIIEDKGEINYQIRNGSDTVGPAAAWTSPNADWFLFAESITRFWSFDGKDTLILIEFIRLKPDRNQVETTQIDGCNLTLVPAALQSRLPTSFRVP